VDRHWQETTVAAVSSALCRAALGLTLVGLSACHWAIPLASSADSGPLGDAGSSDAVVDLSDAVPPPDAPRPSDAPLDTVPTDTQLLDLAADLPMDTSQPPDLTTDPDVSPDLQVPDLVSPPDVLPAPDLPQPDSTASLDTTAPVPDSESPDMSPPDSEPPDMSPPDSEPPDLPPPDIGSDGQPTIPPCVGNGKVVFQYAADMVVCSSSKVTQCDAPAECNQAGGWQLCTASQFTSRGGDTTPIPHQYRNAWMASCFRDGGTLSQPTNAICSSCVLQIAPLIGVGCPCSSCAPQNVVPSNVANLGLTPWDACFTWGSTNPNNMAYWAVAMTDEKYNRVVCCN